eukprot:gene6818-8695_t
MPSKKVSKQIVICWLRRDLRLHDQAALYHALKSGHPVLCLFIFDPKILDALPDKTDRRVQFIHRTLEGIKQQLNTYESDLCVKHKTPEDAWEELLKEYEVLAVYTNRDYEPYAMRRDKKIGAYLSAQGIGFHVYKDQVIFEPNEIFKADSKPYTIYTPFSNKWLEKIDSFYLKSYPVHKYRKGFVPVDGLNFPTLGNLGFAGSEISFPEPQVPDLVFEKYSHARDFPALADGTSHLGVHF